MLISSLIAIASLSTSIESLVATEWDRTYQSVADQYPVGNLQPNTAITVFTHSAVANEIELNDHTYKAEFHFNDDELEAVILRWDEVGHTPVFELIDQLVTTYGEPADESTRIVWHRQWVNDSTVIDLIVPTGLCDRIETCDVNLSFRKSH